MNLLFLPLTTQITINDHVFCIPSTRFIFCLIFVLPTIISIILFASKYTIHSILDSDADYRRRQRPHFINVAYVAIPYFRADSKYAGRSMIFVRDIYDPTGLHLYVLLAGKDYDTYVHNNYRGFLLPMTGTRLETGVNGNQTARVPVLDACMVSVQSRGSVITSGIMNTPVEVDTTLRGSRTLLIREYV